MNINWPLACRYLSICNYWCVLTLLDFPGGASGKEPTSQCMRLKTSSIPGLGRSVREGHGSLLQYSCLENLMDRGAWWAMVHGVAKSQTQMKWLDTWLALTLSYIQSLVIFYLNYLYYIYELFKSITLSRNWPITKNNTPPFHLLLGIQFH